MSYKLDDIEISRVSIGDMTEKIDIETFNPEFDNNFEGNFTDNIIAIASDVWAAVKINDRGTFRMSDINTDGTEIATHIFYCRFWNDEFLEARFIKYNNVRFRIIRAIPIKEKSGLNYQIKFLCALKGSTSKQANTWAT